MLPVDVGCTVWEALERLIAQLSSVPSGWISCLSCALLDLVGDPRSLCNGQDASAVDATIGGGPSVLSSQRCQNADPAAPTCTNCQPL